MVALLERLWTALQPAIRDAESTNPSLAYDTFFKDISSYGPFVSGILSNISAGAPIIPSIYFDEGPGISPVFRCVFGPYQFEYTNENYIPSDAYTKCELETTIVAYNLVGSPFVVICPIFWMSLGDLPPENNCLTISTYINRFRGDGQSLIQYKLWVILDMLARYYIHGATAKTLQVAEVNKCVALSSKDSSMNARNYAYYVACEFDSAVWVCMRR